VTPPQDRKLDGASWVSLLDGETLNRTTPLYWHFLRSKGDVKVAIREGDWKLVARIDQPQFKPGGGITAEDIEFNREAKLMGFELFNLRDDIGESADLQKIETARFEGMKEMMVEKYEEVKAESPVCPEWEWPKYESRRISVA